MVSDQSSNVFCVAFFYHRDAALAFSIFFVLVSLGMRTNSSIFEQERQSVKRTKRKDSFQDPADLSMEVDPETEQSSQIDSDRARRYKIRELFKNRE